MKFTIVLPTYNRADFLSVAIKSILSQTYTDWELIIVDDGSTDNTKDVVSLYKDERIIYLYQENAERSAARNNGIKHAVGEYVCFMDSDEYLEETRLELLHNSIESTGQQVACYYTDIRFEGLQNYVRKGTAFAFPINKDDLINFVIGTPQICCATDILRKYQFNPLLSIGEDMELLFRITDEFPLVYLQNQETIVELEHENRSVSFQNKSKSAEKELETLKIMFSKNHPAYKVSWKNKRKRLSISYFNASTNYLLCRRIKGLWYIVKSILLFPESEQTKYRINIIINFCLKRSQKLSMLIEQ